MNPISAGPVSARIAEVSLSVVIEILASRRAISIEAEVGECEAPSSRRRHFPARALQPREGRASGLICHCHERPVESKSRMPSVFTSASSRPSLVRGLPPCPALGRVGSLKAFGVAALTEL